MECGWHEICVRVSTHPNVSLVRAQAAQILGPAGQGPL